MNKDITSILDGWDFDPESVNARWIKGDDSELRVQLRLDLGLFQMQMKGRPDGKRPHGKESLLEYYQAREKAEAVKGGKLVLDSDACADLQQEAMQYYYRYISLYALRHMEGVVADTNHNLAILDLATDFAENDDLVWQFLQFYPYIRMMNSRARADMAVEKQDYETAISALQSALDDIQEFWSEYGDDDDDDPAAGREMEMLTDLLGQIEKSRPKTKGDRLQDQLRRAIADEDFEKAAQLRDKINALNVGNSHGIESDAGS